MAMEQITVRILDRDYRLSCAPAEKDALLAAVDHVNAQTKAIRDQGKITSSERIAVFAALNIASALRAQTTAVGTATSQAQNFPVDANDPQPVAVADAEIARRMQSINALLDTALANQEALF
jgi:cell division protein ZapA